MIFDLHNDLLTSEENIYKCVDIYSQKTVGVVLAFWSTNYNRLPNVQQYKRKNIYFAIEDMHFWEEDMEEVLLAFNPVYCGLTWNFNNSLAGGAFDDGGLTDKGKRVIALLNRNDIIVDLAHLNRKSFYQVVDRADKVICSHTAFSSLKNHPRNITDEQARLIVEKGGIIGVSPVIDFLENERAFFKTIVYAISRFGENAVAIGSDIHGSVNIPIELQSYDGYNMYELLNKYDLTKECVDKVAFKNAQRVLSIN